MAITVKTKPTSPNVTDTKLVYAVSSSNATLPQFQYVTDVNLGGERLTRLLTYPNPTGNGVLEVSSILGDNLGYDNDWKTELASEADESYKEFTLHFSESYGTSLSSSVTFYPGGASDTIKVFPGTVDPNQGSFNYLDSGSFSILSNYTKTDLAKGNHATLPVYLPGVNKTLDVKYLDDGGSVLDTTTFSLVAGGQNKIFQVPVESGSFGYSDPDWESITVNEQGQTDILYTFNRVRPCYDDGVTFAFINNYGYYEYFSIGNPVRKNTEVGREVADLPTVDYSNLGVYDITRRGEKAYNTTYTDTFDVTTDYLDQETAGLLTELYDSPEVYVQESGKFIPIIITDTTYTSNTNQSRQKLFQYTITYRYANSRYSR